MPPTNTPHAVVQANIIDEFAHIISKKHVGVSFPPGWQRMAVDFLVAASKYDDVIVQMIGEDRGSIVFYWDGGDDLLFQLASELQSESVRVCEICGGVAKRRKPYYVTRCEDHLFTDIEQPLSKRDARLVNSTMASAKRKFKPELE